MKTINLKGIWKQVPIDYYDRGINKNLLQKIWHTNKLRIFKQLTKDYRPKKILDVGCASGIMTNQIAKIFSSSKIYGIDSYKEAIIFEIGRAHV